MIKLQHMSDEEVYSLLNAGGKHSRKAFDELYTRFSAKIYVYCKKVLNNDDVAEDVFQETFTRFYESAQIDRVMTNVAGYLIRIARNLCINEKMKKYNDKVSLDDLQLPVYDKAYDKKQMTEILQLGLDALPEKYREVLVLKEFLDMSYKEIAEVLKTTLPVVRIRIYRAKNKLKEILTPYLDEINDIK